MSPSRRTARLARVVTLAVVAAALRPAARCAALHAQGGVTQQGASSPVTDLMRRGQNALDNLDYRQADSLARTVLDLGVPLTKTERQAALQLLIAALYPEDQQSQKIDSARTFIKQYVDGGSKTISKALSWRGLDSLVALFTRTIAPGKIVIGSRIPGAVLYVNNQPQGIVRGLRSVSVPGEVSVAISVRSERCKNADSTYLVHQADSMLVGYVNPVCQTLPPTWHDTPGSAIDDLLRRAQSELDRLDVARADSMGRSVLADGSTADAMQRERAQFIIAAAEYPEDLPARRRRSDAMTALKAIIRSDIDATIPWEVSWPGLDSAFADAKATTFGIGVQGDSSQAVVGPTGTAAIQVRATRPTSFVLSVVPADGGAPIVSDSTGPTTSGALHFLTMRNSAPIFTTGDYGIVVTGRDESGDTITVRRLAHIEAPPLAMKPLPAALDSAKLLPERSARYGWRGIIASMFIGGGVYALSNVLRADSVKTAKPADSKGIPIAIGLSSAIMLGSFMDPGSPLTGNIAANEALRANFLRSRVDVTNANQQAVATYRTIVSLQPGVR